MGVTVALGRIALQHHAFHSIETSGVHRGSLGEADEEERSERPKLSVILSS